MANERFGSGEKPPEPTDEPERAAALESLFARMVANAADAIIAIDDAQVITLFNSGAERLFGHRAQEVVGQSLDVLLPERFRRKHRWFIEHFAQGTVMARKMGARRRVFALRKNGEEFAADAAISKVEFQGKLSLTVILRDISEQRREEAEQRFLVMAGEMLSSTSLDYARTLSRVSQLAVQSLADWCLVYLKEGTRVRLSEVAHRIPEKRPLGGLPVGLRSGPGQALPRPGSDDAAQTHGPPPRLGPAPAVRVPEPRAPPTAAAVAAPLLHGGAAAGERRSARGAGVHLLGVASDLHAPPPEAGRATGPALQSGARERPALSAGPPGEPGARGGAGRGGA